MAQAVGSEVAGILGGGRQADLPAPLVELPGVAHRHPELRLAVRGRRDQRPELLRLAGDRSRAVDEGGVVSRVGLARLHRGTQRR